MRKVYNNLFKLNLNNIIIFYIFLQPFLAFSYYYFNFKPVVYINTMIILLFYFIFLKVFLKNTINIKNLILLLFLIILILIISLNNIFNEIIFTGNTFIKHSYYFINFIILFLIGIKINLFYIIGNLYNKIKYFLFIDLVIISLFRFDFLNKNNYPSFEASYLIPTFIYSLIKNNNFLIIFHLILFYLHQKRADILVAVIVIYIYLLKKNIIICFIIFFIGLFIILNIETSFLPNRLQQIFIIIQNFDFKIDSSLSERFIEIKNSLEQLKNDSISLILGNGFGWSYKLDDLIGYGYTIRSYTHISFYFIFLVFGIFGVLIFFFYHIYLFYKLNRYSYIEQNLFYFFILLFYFFNSFSVLNFLTNPIYIILLGSALTSIKKAKYNDI